MKNTFETRGEVTAIFLKRKDGSFLETLIDTTDLPLVQELKYSWCAYMNPHIDSYYVKGYTPEKRVYLHRYLLNAPKGLVVDHINHDTLDNRRSNLRVVSNSINGQNRKGATKNSQSGIRNVCWDKTKNKWVGRIRVNGKRILIGYFDNLYVAESNVIKARRQYMR